MLHHFSLHSINDKSAFGFNPMAYSRFKFGDEEVAAAFGTALAKAFIENHLSTLDFNQQLVVIPSPYAFIPTATFAMKEHFMFTMNRWLAEHQFPVLQETKVHRTVTYKEDYGELDAAQRINLIGNDSFHIDSGFLKNKTLLFLDDIKITGGHEKMIKRMIDAYGLVNETYLVYFAELTNKNIHPNIENYLNYYAVKSVFDLDSIINSNRFAINTRIVKYILNSEPGSFQVFIQNQQEWFLSLMYNMAIGNNYHTIEAYRHNLTFIYNLLFKESEINNII